MDHDSLEQSPVDAQHDILLVDDCVLGTVSDTLRLFPVACDILLLSSAVYDNQQLPLVGDDEEHIPLLEDMDVAADVLADALVYQEGTPQFLFHWSPVDVDRNPAAVRKQAEDHYKEDALVDEQHAEQHDGLHVEQHVDGLHVEEHADALHADEHVREQHVVEDSILAYVDDFQPADLEPGYYEVFERLVG